MPDHTPNPLQDLENFGAGSMDLTPLEPAQVRRLGDRRRARRRSATFAIAAVAVVAALNPLLHLRTGAGGAPPADQGIATPAPTPAGPPKVITYPGVGVEVVTDADAQKLVGTSLAFQAYVTDVARTMNANGADCPDAFHGVTVKKYSTAGYAVGGVNDCGGHAALWVTRGGQWQEASGTQEVWDCDVLRYFDISRSFAGDCANTGGGFGPATVSGLRLHMDEAAVTAAGGTIEAGAAEGCRGLLLPDVPRVADQTDGWMSPTKGLVGISARPGMLTPEGIGLGSTRAAVEHTYPQGRLDNGYWVVPLRATSEYEFGFEADGTVGEALLAATDQDCVG